MRMRPPVGNRLEALLKRHGPGEPVVAEHARPGRKTQAAKVLAGENRGGGVEDVEDALRLEHRERVYAMCELSVIVVARASDQVVADKSAAEALASVQQRGTREALGPRIPRAVADYRSRYAAV